LRKDRKKKKKKIFIILIGFSFKNHKKKNDVNKYDLEMWKK